MKKLDSDISSENLAVLICDALVDTEIFSKESFEKAVAIATEEIDVRKAMADYWCKKCPNKKV
jgi:hypothetical protein